MDIRKLMDLASGEMNFRILRLLHEKPMYAGELGERLSAADRTIRVHLHHLRQAGLIDYDQHGRKHLYSINSPFESTAHELLMTLVALSDPVRKRGEDPSPIPPDRFETGSQTSHLNYLKKLLDGYIETFVSHSTHQAGKQLGEDLKNIAERIDDLSQDEWH